MGNVPTKVDHDVSSFESGGHKGTGRTTPSIAASSRNFTPLVGFLPPDHHTVTPGLLRGCLEHLQALITIREA